MNDGIDTELENKEVGEKVRALYEHLLKKKEEGGRDTSTSNRTRAAILRFRVASELFGEKKLTQKQLGKKCGVSACRIGQLEWSVISRLKRFLLQESTKPALTGVAAMIARFKREGILKEKI